MLDASVRAGVDALIPLIEADMAARATASAEPALPVSGGRYASRGVDVATAVDSAPVGSS
jgi:hypothetical protein